MRKIKQDKQPGNIIQLIILLVGLLIVVMAVECCNHTLQEYSITPKHEPASISQYKLKIFWKEKLSIPDEEFVKYVMWWVEGTDYVRIRWISRQKLDGSGDLTLQWAICYYKR